jgi:hypothetical protein
MGASSAGSYEVTPPGRSRAFDAAHRADGSTQRQQPTRQACGESDPMGDATPILTGLRSILSCAAGAGVATVVYLRGVLDTPLQVQAPP